MVGGGVELRAVFDDAPGGARGLGVDRHRVLRPEMQIALDAEAEPDADRGDLG